MNAMAHDAQSAASSAAARAASARPDSTACPIVHDTPVRRLCTLIVTHQCNLNCAYCYEPHKSTAAMPPEVAMQVIKSEFDLVAGSAQFDELAIDFMGGEPLMRFNFIREIAEWVWSAPRPVPYLLFSTTNGTLLNDRRKEWFSRHRDRYYLVLSLDGTPAMHNANRGQCFDQIDLDFFLENWPDQPVKMTVSCDTIGALADGIVYLQHKGFKVGASLGQGMPWSDDSIKEFGRQLRKLAEYYLEHEEIPPVSLLDVPIQHALDSQLARQKKFCGTGTHMATYDVDGEMYPCHMFTPLVLGTSKSRESQAIKFREDATVSDPDCHDCALRNICPTCYGFNYQLAGDVALRDKIMCRLFKVQSEVNCWFQTQLLRRKRRTNPLSLDDARKAKACLAIMDQLAA